MIETAFLYGVATLFLFGIADALAAIPAKRMSPVAITLVIDSFILIFFTAIAVLMWDTYIWNKYTLLAVAGSFSGYFGFYLYIYSLKGGTVGVSTAIANGYPVLATLFGVVVLREFLPLPAVVAILLVVFGIFGLSTRFSFTTLFDRGVTNKSRLFALGAMCLWATQVIIVDRAVTELSPFQATHIGTIVTLVLGLTIFTFSKETFGSLLRQRKSDLFVAALLGVMYFTGMFTLNSALQAGELGIYAAIAGAAPFVSAVFAYLFLGEHLMKKEWFAIIMVVVGLVVLGIVA